MLFDKDKIEPHNLPNQFYLMRHNGKEKTKALKELLRLFSNDVVEVKTYGKFTKKTALPYEIIVVAVDNMKYRKIAFENSKMFAEVFIDGRMGGQVFRLYTIDVRNEEDIKLYEKSLYSDEAAVDEKCTERSIMFNTMGIASFMGKNLTAFLTDKPYKKEIIMDFYNMRLM